MSEPYLWGPHVGSGTNLPGSVHVLSFLRCQKPTVRGSSGYWIELQPQVNPRLEAGSSLVGLFLSTTLLFTVMGLLW